MFTLEQIKPAVKQEIGVYMPYYQGTKRQALPYAIGLYKQGNLEGERLIEGGDSIPFLATWNISMLPADLTQCRIQFDGDAELSYEVTMATFEFVDFLIDVVYALRRKRPADFAKGFYRKLLRQDD
ncbi:MAG: type IV pilus biogenesis protein EbsA [Cyanobacteria bacterium P01_A01_bin.123]